MSQPRNSEYTPDQPMIYRITIQGRLGDQWLEWFDAQSLIWDTNGHTVLTCRVIDQSALHGLLKKVRDLGMPLIAVQHIESDPDARQDIDR